MLVSVTAIQIWAAIMVLRTSAGRLGLRREAKRKCFPFNVVLTGSSLFYTYCGAQDKVEFDSSVNLNFASTTATLRKQIHWGVAVRWCVKRADSHYFIYIDSHFQKP